MERCSERRSARFCASFCLAQRAAALAVQRCKLAVEFSPALPEAHVCLARAMLADNVSNFRPAFDELTAGASVAMNDPRVSHAATANFFAVLFAGLSSAGVL